MRFKIRYNELTLEKKSFVPIDENTLGLTPFGEYRILKLANSFFKNFVLENDYGAEFTTTKTQEIIDEKKTSANKAPYLKLYEQFNELWDDYRVNNVEEFDEVWVIDSTTEIKDKIEIVDWNFTVSEAYAGYLYTNEQLKRFKKDGSDYEDLPKYIRFNSKADFREKHNFIKSEIRAKIGLPDDDTFTVKEVQTNPMMKRATKAQKAMESEEPFLIYAEKLIQSVVSEN